MIPYSPLADGGGLTTAAVARFPMGTHKLVASSVGNGPSTLCATLKQKAPIPPSSLHFGGFSEL